jgi:hypothetical protein
MTKQRQRSRQKYRDLPIALASTSASKTLLAGSIKNGLKHIDLKIMAAEEMPLDFIQQIAVYVNEEAAGFAFQVEMIPAVCAAVLVLVTGACTVMQDILADFSLSREFFQMPVDGGLSDALSGILKMAYYPADRNMGALEGLEVIENVLPLPGVIGCRTFRHRSVSYHGGEIVSI